MITGDIAGVKIIWYIHISTFFSSNFVTFTEKINFKKHSIRPAFICTIADVNIISCISKIHLDVYLHLFTQYFSSVFIAH